MTVPACPAYCSRLRLRPRPPTDRKQETGTGSKKAPDTAGPDAGMNKMDGRTDKTDRRAGGRMEAPLSICADSSRDAEGTQ